MWTELGMTLLLGLMCVLGLLLVTLQAPGIWLIALTAVGYDWLHGWQRLGGRGLAIVFGMAVLAEVMELAGSMLMAKRAGASRRAAWWGLIGGFAGMFLFSLPLPIIGTIAGGIIGCCVGACVGELSVRDDMNRAVKVGLASALGRVMGLVAKLAAAFAMAGFLMVKAIWKGIESH